MSMLQGFTQFINIKIAGTSTSGGAVDDAFSAMDKLEKRSKTMMKMGAGMVVVVEMLAPTLKSFNAPVSQATKLADRGQRSPED